MSPIMFSPCRALAMSLILNPEYLNVGLQESAAHRSKMICNARFYTCFAQLLYVACTALFYNPIMVFYATSNSQHYGGAKWH